MTRSRTARTARSTRASSSTRPRAGWVVEQLGEEAVAERRADGSVVVVLPVVNRDAFRSWVLDLLDHAEVLEPDVLRDDVISWLEAIAGSR